MNLKRGLDFCHCQVSVRVSLMLFSGPCASLWRTWSWRPLWCWLLWSTLKAEAPLRLQRPWPLLHPGNVHCAAGSSHTLILCAIAGICYTLSTVAQIKISFILLLFWPGSVLLTTEVFVGPVSQMYCDIVLESISESSHRDLPERLSWHSVKAVCPHWLFLAS